MHKHVAMSSKQAWQSSIIDTLTPLTPLTTRDDTIAIALNIDTSLKVYSQRITSVLEMTNRLLDRLTRTRHQRTRNTCTLVSADTLTMSVNEKMAMLFSCDDSVLRQTTVNSLGQFVIGGDHAGTGHGSDTASSAINNTLISISSIDFSALYLCPTLKGVECENVTNYGIDYDINYDECIDVDDCNDNDVVMHDDGSDSIDAIADGNVLTVTPFTYTTNKAWAGPDHWPLSRHARHRHKRTRTAFTEQYDRSVLSDRKNTLLKEEDVISRRNDDKSMVNDHRITLEDVYRYNKMDRTIDHGHLSATGSVDRHNKMDRTIDHAHLSAISNVNNTNVENAVNDSNKEISIHDINVSNVDVKEDCRDSNRNETRAGNVSTGSAAYKKRISAGAVITAINDIVTGSEGMSIRDVYNTVRKQYDVSWQMVFVSVLEMVNRHDVGIRHADGMLYVSK